MQSFAPVKKFQFGKVILSSRRRGYQLRTFTSTTPPGGGTYQRIFNLSPPNTNFNGRNHFSSFSSSTGKVDHHPQPEGSEQPNLRHPVNLGNSQPGEEPRRTREEDGTRRLLDGELGSWEWLNEYGPCYAVQGSKVKIIQTPQDFYQVLLDKSKSAKRRVTLSSLYFGTGPLESQLVGALNENMRRGEGLEVKVLLDYTRGSRGNVNSRTMLVPLMGNTQGGSSCQVFLYHTPTLRGARKKILPQRWNELVGIQHMKIYIFDDNVLITGANLSNDYFTNRQDRYFLIENCREMADFYDGLITTVSTFSFRMDPENKVHLHSNWTLDPASPNSTQFIQAARSLILNYYEQSRKSTQTHLKNLRNGPSQGQVSIGDTWIFPLIQMGPFHISYDDEATLRILETPSPGSRLKLATGYFNLTPNYIQTIIHKSMAHFQILMAHPKANGFLGANFPAGGIPAAYTLLATRFFNAVQTGGQEGRIEMFEYLRPDWTFHGKGLWFYPPGELVPFVTLIGSPNFGYRSVYRDLETQLYIVTLNDDLRSALDEEQSRLYSHSNPFSEQVFIHSDRYVPLWVHLVIRFFKNFF